MPASTLANPRTLDDMLLFRLWRLQSVAGALVVRMCEAEFGVTRREWRVLAQLAQHDGALSSQLADYAGLDRARTSRAVTGLATKRLVQRQPRPGNRREVALRLTAEGWALHARMLPRVAAINRQLLAALSAAEVDALEALVRRLQAEADAMAQMREPPPAANAPAPRGASSADSA